MAARSPGEPLRARERLLGHLHQAAELEFHCGFLGFAPLPQRRHPIGAQTQLRQRRQLVGQLFGLLAGLPVRDDPVNGEDST